MPAPIITPAGPLIRDGKSLTDFTADQDVTWATSGGTLSNVLAQSVTWEALNQSGVWTLSGDNGPDAPTVVSITVRAVIPNFWTWRNPIHAKKDVLIFKPVYGPTQTRGFGDSSPIHDWELGNEDSEIDNFLELKAFWDWHHPGRPFDLVDPVLEERRTYESDSDLNYHYNDSGGVSWSMRIKEAYPYAVVA